MTTQMFQGWFRAFLLIGSVFLIMTTRTPLPLWPNSCQNKAPPRNLAPPPPPPPTTMADHDGKMAQVLNALGLLLGVGFGVRIVTTIGRDSPLTATVMSDYVDKMPRGAFIAAASTQQGFGILSGGIVSIIVSAAFNAWYLTPYAAVDAWASVVAVLRKTLMILGASTYCWRMKVRKRRLDLVAQTSNSSYTEKEKAEKEKTGAQGSNSSGLFYKKFILFRHGIQLFLTTIAWFLLDMAVYSNNLFLHKDISSALQKMFLVALCNTVHGYWVTVFSIDHNRVFRIQLLGFLFFFFFFIFALSIKVPYHGCIQKGENTINFLVLYAFTFFFSNFVVPADQILLSAMTWMCHRISKEDENEVAAVAAV